MTATIWAVSFAGITALAAILTAGVAAWSLLGARSDSRDRTRPLVTASFRKGPSLSHGAIYLVVNNVGKSVARDVNVAFDPELPDYETTEDGQQAVAAPFIRKRYGRPISVLAPGQILSSIYYRATAQGRAEEPMPDVMKVSVTYLDDHKRKYTDIFELDLEVIKVETQANPGDGNEPVLRQNKALESIAWELWS